MKIIENTLFVLLVLSGLFIIGPQTEAPDLVLPQPEISLPLSELNDWIKAKEAVLDNIKVDNAAKLEFYDSIPQKTAYSVLYLTVFLPVVVRVILCTVILLVHSKPIFTCHG